MLLWPFNRRQKCVSGRRVVLITGASTGLGLALVRELSEKDGYHVIKFQLYVQYQKGAKSTPVKDPFKVWDDAKPKTKRVAELSFFKQDFTSLDKQEFCEYLSMSAWHNLKDHEPMGNLNRARRYVYRASTSHRDGGVTPDEPTVIDIEKVFGPFEDE